MTISDNDESRLKKNIESAIGQITNYDGKIFKEIIDKMNSFVKKLSKLDEIKSGEQKQQQNISEIQQNKEQLYKAKLNTINNYAKFYN